jgi:hypothetical protein
MPKFFKFSDSYNGDEMDEQVQAVVNAAILNTFGEFILMFPKAPTIPLFVVGYGDPVTSFDLIILN